MRKCKKTREKSGSVGASGCAGGEREMQRGAQGESESGARADAVPGSVRCVASRRARTKGSIYKVFERATCSVQLGARVARRARRRGRAVSATYRTSARPAPLPGLPPAGIRSPRAGDGPSGRTMTPQRVHRSRFEDDLYFTPRPLPHRWWGPIFLAA
ncbi:hypothetical protein RR48_11729 [Papilio machaon]|uniref:Uncharacterized protein n=1 Tax=Papilio machaon TaxID=76193 RepID=A0A194QMC3_PAPMA|nr:hypothetical protein RR48_11729 [Papilio machaon]